MIAGVLRDCDGFRITRTGADRIRPPWGIPVIGLVVKIA